MLIITYDISDDKVRAKFSKFLKKFGRKIQYSVYEIDNSPRVLNNIKTEINLRYEKLFEGSDSVLIFSVCEGCEKKIMRFGYAKNEESGIIFV